MRFIHQNVRTIKEIRYVQVIPLAPFSFEDTSGVLTSGIVNIDTYNSEDRHPPVEIATGLKIYVGDIDSDSPLPWIMVHSGRDVVEMVDDAVYLNHQQLPSGAFYYLDSQPPLKIGSLKTTTQ